MPPRRARPVMPDNEGNAANQDIDTREELSPDNLWFTNHDVASNITVDLKSHYDEPCTSWSNAPEEHKVWWWNAFMTRYTWAPELEGVVKKAWKKKAGERLKGMVNNAMSDPNKIHRWLTPEVRSQLQELRESPIFKKRSEQNRLNKTTGPKAGSVHTTGSISAEETARRLALNSKGKRPSASQLFVETHTRKQGEEIVFCDDRAKVVWDEFQRLKAIALDTGSQATEDELYLEAAGGMNAKGLVYGLGNSSSIFYQRDFATSRSSPSTHTPSLYAQFSRSAHTGGGSACKGGITSSSFKLLPN